MDASRTCCGGIERGLRVIGLVCSKFRPGKTSRRELVRFIQEEFECSRATAYRTASAAIDVMGLVTREEDLDIQATAPARHGSAPHACAGGGYSDRYVTGFGLQIRTAEG
jgi:hypothetical protein